MNGSKWVQPRLDAAYGMQIILTSDPNTKMSIQVQTKMRSQAIGWPSIGLIYACLRMNQRRRDTMGHKFFFGINVVRAQKTISHSFYT